MRLATITSTELRALVEDYSGQRIPSDIGNCEGWPSPGGHSSGGRALTA